MPDWEALFLLDDIAESVGCGGVDELRDAGSKGDFLGGNGGFGQSGRDYEIGFGPLVAVLGFCLVPDAKPAWVSSSHWASLSIRGNVYRSCESSLLDHPCLQ